MFYSIKVLLTSFTLLIYCSVFAYGDSLEYQARGDRWEGIKPRPVSGSDIRLLSALVDYTEPYSEFPSKNKILFYLDKKAELDLTVRELLPKKFYLLDRIKEKETWQQGFNTYEWSTETVLKPLNLVPEQLGVVAQFIQVNEQNNQATDSIVPVILYHSDYPQKINSYRFAFKVGNNANLNYAIYADDNETPLLEDKLGKKMGGEPFVITWDCSHAMAGNYELVVDGYMLRNNTPIYQSIKFYHQPDVKGNF